MTTLFDGMAGLLNATFGGPVVYWDKSGVAREIQAVFRYLPQEIYGDDDAPSIVDQPMLQVPKTLSGRIERGVEIDVDGKRFSVVNRQPTQASPASDAFVTYQLEPLDRPNFGQVVLHEDSDQRIVVTESQEAFRTFVVDHAQPDFALDVPGGVQTVLPFSFERAYSNGPSIYDGHDFFPNGRFDPIGDDPGGMYEIEISLDVTKSVIETGLVLSIDIGGSEKIVIDARSSPLIGPVGEPLPYTMTLDVYCRETFQANNGAFLVLASNPVYLANARAKVSVERIR